MKTVRNMVLACVAMVALSAFWLGAPARDGVGGAALAGCTKQQGSALLSIVTETGECVGPIVFQGLLAGQGAGAIVDAALACAGATAEGVLAYVESLISGAFPEAGAAQASPEMQQRIAALHFELLNRVAAKRAVSR
jgi:hypothetical protein